MQTPTNNNLMGALLITADDFGLTKGVTDSILEAVDNGVLNNVSILANGHAFDYAIGEYKKRSAKLRISLHLNLTEGPSVAPRGEVLLLVDKNGLFKHSFVSLWFFYLLSFPNKRQRIQAQIKAELSAQIRKTQNALDNGQEIRVDGHQHIHMIPFVFNELLDIAKKENITSARTASEPFFLSWPTNFSCMIGMIKNLLLYCLDRYNRPKARALNIATNDYLLGIVHTGQTTEEVIKNSLTKIIKK